MSLSKSGDNQEESKEVVKTRYDHRAAYISDGSLSIVGWARADAATLTDGRGQRGSWDRSIK